MIVFNGIERQVKEFGSSSSDPVGACRELNRFKNFEGRRLSDDEYFQTMVLVTFYSGFRAATVTQKYKQRILEHFPGWKIASDYAEADFQRISTDSHMIRNKPKIRACIRNAAVFAHLIKEHGSFQDYVERHSPTTSTEGLERFKKSLQRNFAYIGPVTAYHFMTEIGLPVLKPDRVICRLLSRLGFIEHENDEFEAVRQGKRFSEATGHPIRYIDIVLVAFGQVESKEFGITRGVCLDKPRCGECAVNRLCNEFVYQSAAKTRDH